MVANEVIRQPFYFIISTQLIFSLNGIAFGYQDKGYLYLSPLPEAEYVAAETSILVRFMSQSPYELTNLAEFVHISGEFSGEHDGVTDIATDGRTIIFKPQVSFHDEEMVTVTISPEFGNGENSSVETIQYQFIVGKSPDWEKSYSGRRVGSRDKYDALTELNPTISNISERHFKIKRDAINSVSTSSREYTSQIEADRSRIMNSGVSIPSDFPEIVIPVNINPAEGYIFINFRGDYSLILDNNGEPVWYQHRNGDWGENDFKVQENGNITLWKDGQFIELDQSYQNVTTYHTVDGYWTDDHELHVLEIGGYLMLGVRGQYIDISKYIPGGPTNEYVYETVVQEFTTNGELIFQWRGWDHFDPRYISGPDNSGNSPFWGWDLTHMNSIDIDEDGHILVSSRHAHEITKINRDSGEIIWRLGGFRNDFEFLNDTFTGFRGQHDIHSLGKNRYLLYDNGNQRSPLITRAVEYELDIDKMTATLVWEFRDSPDFYTGYMGSAQRLANGNTIICGVLQDYAKAMEVDISGNKQFILDFVDYTHTYRVYRYNWEGIANKPYLITESHQDHLTLIFNQFGDHDVEYYNIYGGTSPNPTTLLDTSATTLKRIRYLLDGRYYFRVTSVNHAGIESAYSNEEEAYVEIIDPTMPSENLVFNGDFSKGMDGWAWQVNTTVSAEWEIVDSVSQITVDSGGNGLSDIQLFQSELKLFQGEEYILEFDAAAEEMRIIQVRVKENEDPYTDYSRIGYIALNPIGGDRSLEQFSYRFNMENLSDLNCRLVFELGNSESDIFIDNISLKRNFNALPAISLTNPDKDKVVWLGEELVISAEANDADGSINRVEFYRDNQKVDEDETDPFQSNWLISRRDHYQIYARAFDNENAISKSETYRIHVVDTTNNQAIIESNIPIWYINGNPDYNPENEGLPAGSDGSVIGLWLEDHYAKISFNGTGIEVYGVTFSYAATGDIFIDGNLVANDVSWVSNPAVSERLVFKSNVLANKEHTLRVENNGDWINIDYLKIFGNYNGNRNTKLTDNYYLFPVFPNPFNSSTHIRFQLPYESKVTLKIYNLLGQEIETLIDEQMKADIYQIIFDGSHLPTGIYICQMKADNYNSAQKLLLLK
jgi:hypothetical protein